MSQLCRQYVFRFSNYFWNTSAHFYDKHIPKRYKCFQTFRPCLSRLWTFKEEEFAKFLPQTGHVCLTPWVNKWRLRHWRFFSAFPQKLHINVLASEWDRMCSFKFDFTLNAFPHISQTCLWRTSGLCSSCIRIWNKNKDSNYLNAIINTFL